MEDVTLTVTDHGTYDVVRKQLDVIVWAKDYEWRVENKDGRAWLIARDIYRGTTDGPPPEAISVQILLCSFGYWDSDTSALEVPLSPQDLIGSEVVNRINRIIDDAVRGVSREEVEEAAKASEAAWEFDEPDDPRI